MKLQAVSTFDAFIGRISGMAFEVMKGLGRRFAVPYIVRNAQSTVRTDG